MIIGIDLGGTKIEVLAIHEGKEIMRKRDWVPKGDYTGTIKVLAHLVAEVEKHIGTQANIGIATPGAEIPHSGLMKNCNSVCLNNQHLRRDLSQALQREVRIANDANCFTLSEATDGSASHKNVVFGIIIGTGCGGGIVVNGQLLNGLHGITGEWGHTLLPQPKPIDLPLPHCYCGRYGCVETYCCGPAIEKDYFAKTHENIPCNEIVELAAQGHQEAEQALQRFEHRFSRSLAQVINILDPDIIVLGGGLSNLMRLYQNLPQLIASEVFSNEFHTPIVKNLHGDSSGVRGAARLWQENEAITWL